MSSRQMHQSLGDTGHGGLSVRSNENASRESWLSPPLTKEHLCCILALTEDEWGVEEALQLRT